MINKIRVTVAGIFIFFLLANLAFAQDDQEDKGLLFGLSEESPAPKQDTEAQPKTIVEIEIQGNKSIATSTIISHIRAKKGDKYSAKALSGDLKNLYNLGFFSDVQMDLQDVKGGIKVIFQVEERTILDKIYLEGQFVLNEQKIRGAIKAKEGDFLDLRQLKENIAEIEQMYAKYGYSLAKVDYKLVTDEKTNKSDLYLLIDEGSKVGIAKINVKGNSAFRDGEIIKVMKTKKRGFFSAGAFDKDVLDEDMERIVSFYKRSGYLDAKADNEVSINYPKKSIYITVNVKEGKRYYVGNIKISGNENVSTDDILNKLALKADSIFSQEQVESDVAEVQGLYFEKGFIFSQVKPVTVLDSQTGRVGITYNIQENKVAYIDKIKIRGNSKTKDVVIRRELRILPGEKFDGAKLKRSRERLINLGFFEEVNYSSEPGTASDHRDLVVDVKEAKTGEMSFGAGYSTVDKFVGFVEVAQKNFDWRNWKTFTGAGEDIRVRGSWGTMRQDYLFSFTEPWIFNRPISAGFDAFHNTHDKSTDVGYAYDEKRTGGDLRLGREFGEYVKGDVMYKIENVDIRDIDESASNDLKKEEGSNVISSLTLGVSRDTRDNIYSPTRGTVLGGSVGCAGGPFGGDKNFVRITANASQYVSFFKKAVLELSLRGGIVDPFSDSDDVPIYERFFAGGADTIRGYKERAVGPVDTVTREPLGGEATLIGNLEVTYPLLDFIKGAVFYDIGNVWAKVSDFGKGNFYSGFGVGVRVKTPIGPIKLDYGWPTKLAPGEDKKEGQFHFSMSHGF